MSERIDGLTRRWRAVVSIVVAGVATGGLLWWLHTLPPSAIPWTYASAGHVTRSIPYDTVNDVWLLVRAGLGLYISGVFVIIALQLLGTWRRLLVSTEEAPAPSESVGEVSD